MLLQCTAMSKQTGCRCKNHATPGWNVCRFHGSRGGRPIVNGMYSERVNKSLKETYEQFLDYTDTLETVNEDIALMRAMMVDALGTEAKTIQEKKIQQSIFLRYMRDIRDATALKDSIESKFSVSVQTVQVFLNRVLFILQRNIEDPELLDTIVNQLRQIRIVDEDNPKYQKPTKRLKG